VQQPHRLDNIKQEQVNQVYKHKNHRNHNQHKQSSHNHNHSNKNSSNTCGMCGYEYPHKNSCPAKGKKCNNCGRLNQKQTTKRILFKLNKTFSQIKLRNSKK
jgi:hypothetical protein